jgi:hypothetical protein
MGKFKLAGRKKKTAGPGRAGAVPCIAILILGFALIMLLFFAIMKYA